MRAPKGGNDGGTPEILATDVLNGFALMVVDGTVYWTDRGTQMGSAYANGSVRKVSASGSSMPVTIASGQADPCGLAVDATYVYWVDQADLGCNGCPNGTLNRAPR